MGFVVAFIAKSFDETDHLESPGKGVSLRRDRRFSVAAVLLCFLGMEEAIWPEWQLSRRTGVCLFFEGSVRVVCMVCRPTFLGYVC